MDDRQEGQLAQVEKPGVEGHQPTTSNLDSSDPPGGGSAVSPKPVGAGREIVVSERRPEGYIPVKIRKWQDGLHFAAALINSGLTKNRGITTPERGLLVILTGQEMGIGPARSLRSMFVTPNGTIGMEANLMTALFKQRGGQYRIVKSDTEICEILFWLNGQEHTEKFTIEDAERAELLTPSTKGAGQRADGKPGKDNWRRYPQLMLRWRTLANGIRFLAPEVFGGFITEHEADEVEDESRAGQSSTDANVDALKQKLADQTAEEMPTLDITDDGEVLTICPECGISTSEGDLADRDKGICMWCATGDRRPVDDSDDPAQEELVLDE